MPEVYLGLGSNSPDQQKMLTRARILLNIYLGPISLASKVYKTAPWGYEEQPPFSNQVLHIHTQKTVDSVYEELLHVEQLLEKQKDSKFGPRNIDIDLLLFDDLVACIGALEIPHPRMHKRNFVLIPLAEIAPNLVHPGMSKTISQLVTECNDDGSVAVQNIMH